jgi:hypothetical protein
MSTLLHAIAPKCPNKSTFAEQEGRQFHHEAAIIELPQPLIAH